MTLDVEYNYNILEIKHNVKKIKQEIDIDVVLSLLKQSIIKMSKPQLQKLVVYINNIIKCEGFTGVKKLHTGKKVSELKESITNFVDENKLKIDIVYWRRIYYMNNHLSIDAIQNNIDTIEKNQDKIKDYFGSINSILEDSVYGHKDAKRQVERIIGQWINGDQSGYCFGFEGPPGVGKTSLALNGISKCLVDTDGTPRPFSIIAMGGSSNGSTLEGHNYTYVGSTWGKIVDIIIEKKCMNPIIFIDELEKNFSEE